MADTKRKKRSRKGRRNAKWIKIVLIAVLALGLISLVAVLLQENAPESATIKAYPMEYTDLIRTNAAQQEIDPAYVAAIILAESSYRPDATSAVNAQGLMQIMPDTGAWLAGKFGEKYTDGCLYDPETSIRYGCWYLGYLTRRFNGDLMLATAAYHSGQGTVDQWLANPLYSANGVKLDVIPGPEAEKYVNRVLNYYEEYKKLYADL